MLIASARIGPAPLTENTLLSRRPRTVGLLQSARVTGYPLELPLLNADGIRRRFIDFFVERGHLHLAGLPLVTGDPNVTTLFTIAGMQQMIPYFLGREQPPNINMVTVQKTVRTVNIDDVGDDTHLTYFEMLGNFSVGGYFKKEAIRYTWDFLVGSLEIPAERWWAVTYPDDEEARDAWLAVGMPADRIGETVENWWGPPGNAGPCGPNSEIHYDRGAGYGCGGSNCRPEAECCGRFVEVWNDVFMSYFQDESGERRPLPWNNIDTGMGYERLVAVAQGVATPYETDIFQPIIGLIAELSGTHYGRDQNIDRSLRIVADHVRAATFIIADGVMPAAGGRGYVLRRLIRRAALHGKLLGIDRPFLTRPVDVVIEVSAGYHRDLPDRRDHVVDVMREEEKRFSLTLTRGLTIFEEMAARSSATEQEIPGEDAFVLYDTHGFPLELTQELARERGLTVAVDAFTRQLQEQRERARQGASRRNIGASPETHVAVAEEVPPTTFTGYDELRTTTSVAALITDGHSVPAIETGDKAEVILASTPFYAEAGGQVGDTGAIRSDGAVVRVVDTQRPFASLIAQYVIVEDGTLAVGDIVEAEVDAERRLHVLPHHSGTHLLHQALQEVLGKEATQAGSLVAPDRLRFDFNWPRALTGEELREVQDRVNAAIWANLPVTCEVMPYDQAIRAGAMALFGEKYADHVRVISMGDWSKELCGGTHVGATGDIGSLIITEEHSTGSGVRRIEAVAGAAAYAYVHDLRAHLDAVTRALEARPDSVVVRAEQLLGQAREQEKRIEALTRRLASREADSLLRNPQPVDSMTVIADQISADSMEYLKAATDAVKSRLDRGIVVLASVTDGNPAFTMAVTGNLVDEGYRADTILREAAQQAKGNAGGRPEFAQGGGRDASKVSNVLQTALEIIKRKAEG